jgi:hypothetical protein
MGTYNLPVGGGAHQTEDAMTTKLLRAAWVAAIGGVLLIAGCKISDEGSGGDKKVSIEAPGASVKVDTPTVSDSGMPLYPGAQEKRGAGNDKDRANVNVNTPFLKVKVVVLSFTSNDTPEKILAFYRGKMQRYGTVLECRGAEADVQLGNKLDKPVSCGTDRGKSGEISLKVGIEGNQHYVSVKPRGTGSEFELVYLHVGSESNDDHYSDKQPS